MPTEEAKAQFEDFVRFIPSRMTQLQRVVVRDPVCKNWEADFSRESIVGLMTWFCRRVCVDAERRMIDFIPLDPVPTEGIPRYRGPVAGMSACVRSIAMDIGIYWAECLRVAERGFVWRRVARPKSNVILNYPSITGSRLGFEYVPWFNFQTWLNRYFEDGEDPMWWPRLYDDVLAGPRIGEKGKEHQRPSG